MPSDRFDLTVIGAGIVGLSTAMHLQERYPRARMAVLEKEPAVATHQTGHNSGVIHSGIYYKPGSVKAKLCVAGRKSLLDFCDQQGVAYELCGKVIVATCEEEVPRLQELIRRGQANGVEKLEMIGPERLRELEPHARGIEALHSPTTGIVDFSLVAQAIANRFHDMGGEIMTACRVHGLERTPSGWIIKTGSGEIGSRYLVNCAGLFSDRVANMSRVHTLDKKSIGVQMQIVPFRGEFYQLIPEKRNLVRGLIYPVPDTGLPFLGVHCSRTAQGEVEMGPNAVLAFAREGYRKHDINLFDLWQIISYGGFWTLARSHWSTAIDEFRRSISKSAFVKSLQRLLPDVQAKDLKPARSGVRAQAVSADGRLLDDFVIAPEPNAIHVLNAPSPGATASLAIGERIRDMTREFFSPDMEKFH